MTEGLVGEAFGLVGWAVSTWWCLSMAAWLITHAQAPVRAAGRWTAPGVLRLSMPGTRQLARGLVSIGLLAVQACSPPPPPAPPRLVWQADVDPGPTSTATSSASRPSTAPTPADTETAASADGVATAARAPITRTHEVRPGDNLWSISVEALTSHLSRPPSAAETAPYWQQLIDLNLGALRSGDPDLLHPGESIHLPHP